MSEPYSFEDWDKQQFQRAVHIFELLQQQRDGERKMRDMILELYFGDQNGQTL